jgi:hypothetical protein
MSNAKFLGRERMGSAPESARNSCSRSGNGAPSTSDSTLWCVSAMPRLTSASPYIFERPQWEYWPSAFRSFAMYFNRASGPGSALNAFSLRRSLMDFFIGPAGQSIRRYRQRGNPRFV